MSFLSGIGNFAKGAWNGLIGHSDYHASPQQQAFGTDPATQNAYNNALLQYNDDKARGLPVGAPPTLESVQQGTDRSSTLGAIGQYTPLISQLQAQAAGNGPSAAMQIYQNTADQNAQRGMALAASGNVAPGQRAALLGQAITGAATGDQVAAGNAAALRSQEQQQATQNLGQALGAQTGAYSGLLSGDQGVNAQNQQAGEQAQQINSGVASSNAANASAVAKSAISAMGKAAMAGG